ncbi:type II toxin-antitoxin system RnlA family toxin [Acinetobacter courvalinii]|uniref:type II toxin-antitoxin system RnlA family toxin n=1 Tax=Acinetobacter courvalinii TaxID=280147 RepID=UPI0021D37A2D|nr:type II toxin-antitoxin system RnlA family toxin [Acinetobacter courvalinii]MCU4576140.1 type II toxin-antitoxin system RnlA family toxin [Acinetobacter courvalinii]
MAESKSPYKDLNFPKNILEETIHEFSAQNGLVATKLPTSTSKKEIYELVKTGAEKALFEIYHLKDGKTTFHPKIGKNQLLSTELADHLLGQANVAEGQITYTLAGYTVKDIEPVIELMTEKKNTCGTSFFSFEKIEFQGGFRFAIQNVFYQDKLTVTSYSTGRLVIQGLPLSCYDEFVFQMSALLNAEGLAKVISRTDESAVQLVEQRMIESTLASIFEDSYGKIPPAIKSMLISGSTLRSIKPKLPDYTCMVFPDLRAIEGVIKNIFYINNVEYVENIGEIFEHISQHNYKVKDDFHTLLPSKMLRTAMGNAYSFYHKHRHGLFHMNDEVGSSRTITSIEKAINLTDDVYKLIKDVYKASP